MNDLDNKALAISVEQAKTRVALDILRFVNRSDGRGEAQLYKLALDHLITTFGGDPPDDNEEE